jgi:hypothetical protein
VNPGTNGSTRQPWRVGLAILFANTFFRQAGNDISIRLTREKFSFPCSAWERLIHRSAVIEEDAERPKIRYDAEHRNEGLSRLYECLLSDRTNILLASRSLMLPAHPKPTRLKQAARSLFILYAGGQLPVGGVSAGFSSAVPSASSAFDSDSGIASAVTVATSPLSSAAFHS